MQESAIWKDFDELTKRKDTETPPTKISFTQCSGCASENLIDDGCDLVCVDCGLVTKEHLDFIGTFYDTCGNIMYYNNSNEEFNNTPWKHTKPNDKIKKMTDWMKWSNDERNEHKLKRHVGELCCKLEIQNGLVEPICNLCVYVFREIKKHDGLKRGNVKNGIILACIMYIGKSSGVMFNYNAMCSKLGMGMKYVTHAEDLMIELSSKNKLNLDISSIHKTVDPMDCVYSATRAYKGNIPSKVLDQTSKLVQKYSGTIHNHTPHAIGIACLFKALKDYGAQVNFKEFCKAFNSSMPTISKTLQAMTRVQ